MGSRESVLGGQAISLPPLPTKCAPSRVSFSGALKGPNCLQGKSELSEDQKLGKNTWKKGGKRAELKAETPAQVGVAPGALPAPRKCIPATGGPGVGAGG